MGNFRGPNPTLPAVLNDGDHFPKLLTLALSMFLLDRSRT